MRIGLAHLRPPQLGHHVLAAFFWIREGYSSKPVSSGVREASRLPTPESRKKSALGRVVTRAHKKPTPTKNAGKAIFRRF